MVVIVLTMILGVVVLKLVQTTGWLLLMLMPAMHAKCGVEDSFKVGSVKAFVGGDDVGGGFDHSRDRATDVDIFVDGNRVLASDVSHRDLTRRRYRRIRH